MSPTPTPTPGWRGYPEGFHIKPNAGKLLPGNGVSLPGFLCTPSFSGSCQASSCQKLPLSPLVTSHPLLLTGSRFILSTCLRPFPCCLCHLFPKSQRSSLLYLPHHCAPLGRGPQCLSLSAHSVMLPVGRAHVFPSCRRTLSLPVSFPVPFSEAQPE